MSAERWLRDGLHTTNVARWPLHAASLVTVLFIPLQAGFLALFFEALVLDAQPNNAYLWLALFALMLLLRTAASLIDAVLAHNFGQRVIQGLDQQLFTALADLPETQRSRKTRGAWVSMLHTRLAAIEGWYSGFYPQLWRVGLSCVLLLCVITWLNPFAGLLLLLTLPLLPLFMYLLGVHTQSVVAGQQQMLDYLSGFFADRLRHLPLLARFAAIDRSVQTLNHVHQEYQQRTDQVLRHALLSNAVLELFASMAIALLAVFIGLGLLGYIHYAGADQLTLFTGLLILFLVAEFFLPLKELGQEYHRRGEALAAADELRQALVVDALKPHSNAGQHNVAINSNANGLTQSESPPWLLQISPLILKPDPVVEIKTPALCLAPGAFVAVVGPSGAGKSLFLAVLAGLEPVAQGVIQRHQQADCILIPQQPWFLQASVSENLRLANQHVTQQQMHQALQTLGLDLPLDLPVGFEGGRLSGGMRQRLALAQAWVSGARIWLLDEITTGLDPEQAQRVLDCLQQARSHGVAVVVATHCQSVRAQAEQVVSIMDENGTNPCHA